MRKSIFAALINSHLLGLLGATWADIVKGAPAAPPRVRVAFPHQGTRECNRRVRQMRAGVLQPI